MNSFQGRWLYGWSIAHVQQYLLAGNALRDIQGGSQLLEILGSEHFSRALERVGLTPDAVLSQAAAGARVWAADREPLETLHAAWPAVVAEVAPGAQVDQALVPVEPGGLAEAQRTLGRRLRAARSAPSRDLPEAGPLVVRCRTTALPAEDYEAVRKEGATPVDRGARARLKAWRAISDKTRRCLLDDRFLPEEARHLRFASGRDVEEELTRPDDPYVAVLHADGNGVGNAVNALLVGTGAEVGDRFRRFSEGLAEATRNAARDAVAAVIVPEQRQGVLPARPVVLGGDDVTIILRADLGVRFSEAYLEAFERHTASVRDGGLTACAGVAVVKVRFPFDRAHGLADGLCARAKRRVKGPAGDVARGSAVAFHRVTTALPEDAADVFDRELASADKAHRASFEAYGVGATAGAGVAPLADLRGLADALPAEQKGALRTLVSLLVEEPVAAQPAFDRILEVLRLRTRERNPDPNRQAPKTPRAVKHLVDRLGALTGAEAQLWKTQDGVACTPLRDAYLLKSLEGWRTRR